MMQSKLIVITGNIASGKSTLSKLLKIRGYPVIDADKISREIYLTDSPTYIKIVHEFGDMILNKDRSINRKRLSELVFSDKKKLSKLEEITHLDIILEIEKKIKEIKSDLIFIEIPLYFETKSLLDKILPIDEVWMVYADRKIRIDRLMKRDSIDLEKAENIINSQLDYGDYKNQVDEIIVNNRSDGEFKEKIEELFKRRKI